MPYIAFLEKSWPLITRSDVRVLPTTTISRIMRPSWANSVTELAKTTRSRISASMGFLMIRPPPGHGLWLRSELVFCRGHLSYSLPPYFTSRIDVERKLKSLVSSLPETSQFSGHVLHFNLQSCSIEFYCLLTLSPCIQNNGKPRLSQEEIDWFIVCLKSQVLLKVFKSRVEVTQMNVESPGPVKAAFLLQDDE